jgi:hypothetical protein
MHLSVKIYFAPSTIGHKHKTIVGKVLSQNIRFLKIKNNLRKESISAWVKFNKRRRTIFINLLSIFLTIVIMISVYLEISLILFAISFAFIENFWC